MNILKLSTSWIAFILATFSTNPFMYISYSIELCIKGWLKKQVMGGWVVKKLQNHVKSPHVTHTHTHSWHDALGTKATYSTFPYGMLQKLAY